MPSAGKTFALVAVISLAASSVLAIAAQDDEPQAEPLDPIASPAPTPSSEAVGPAFTITSVEPSIDGLAIDWTVDRGDFGGFYAQGLAYRYDGVDYSYVLGDSDRTTILAAPSNTEVLFCLVSIDYRTDGSSPVILDESAPGCAVDKTLAPPPAPVVAAPAPAPAPAAAAAPAPRPAPAAAQQPAPVPRAEPKPPAPAPRAERGGDDDRKGKHGGNGNSRKGGDHEGKGKGRGKD